MKKFQVEARIWGDTKQEVLANLIEMYNSLNGVCDNVLDPERFDYDVALTAKPDEALPEDIIWCEC